MDQKYKAGTGQYGGGQYGVGQYGVTFLKGWTLWRGHCGGTVLNFFLLLSSF